MKNKLTEREFLIASRLSKKVFKTFRRARLDEKQVTEVALKVLKVMKVPVDGEIVLLDQKPVEREARIAFKLISLEFDTREEYEQYKKKHDINKDTKVKIKNEQDSRKKDNKETGIKLQEEIENIVGKGNTSGWNNYGINKSQISYNTVIYFPDGRKEKYKNLNEEEKLRVQEAVRGGKVVHRGMNDYNKVDKETLEKNMFNNLSRYEDSSVELTENKNKSLLTENNVDRFLKELKVNAGNVLKKYYSSMSDVSRPMLEKHIENISSAIKEGITDGSLDNVNEADLDEFCREEIKRMIHQEIETRGRSLGDHGIRHLSSNSDNMFAMLNQIDSGDNITGKDKLMGMSVIVNHDIGYTLGKPGVSFGGDHRVNSDMIFEQEFDRYEKIFGRDSALKMKIMVRKHDAPELDWANDPLMSSIRLADNISLFGKDKVQDLFIRSEKAMEVICKMRLAVEIEPVKPKLPKREDFKELEEYKEAVKKYNEDLEDYNSLDIQNKVQYAKKLQSETKKELHDIIDKGDFHEYDKELLHRQVDEMSEEGFSTSRDILSRYSGRIEGFTFDRESNVMRVNMGYSPEGLVIDSLFGDNVALKQFDKFVKDMGGKPIEGKVGQTELGVPPTVVLNINNFGNNEETAVTKAMKEFINKTPRFSIWRALGMKTLPEAFKELEKGKDKFTASEWKKLESVFKRAKKISDVSGFLTTLDLLKTEKSLYDIVF